MGKDRQQLLLFRCNLAPAAAAAATARGEVLLLQRESQEKHPHHHHHQQQQQQHPVQRQSLWAKRTFLLYSPT